MARIKAIYIYPIKGMRGISLSESELQPEGLRHDRRWMLVDETGTFLSQRTHPQMARFVPEMHDDALIVRYEGTSIEVPVAKATGSDLAVSVFDDRMHAREVDADLNQWFSGHLGQSVRLVRHSRNTDRQKNFKKYVPDSVAATTTPVSFADGYPYLLLGTASMDLLNSKLDDPLPADRFRANLLLYTDRPHEEDDWNEFQLGSARMLSVKPCARCQVTTIDQQTGVKGTEPLRTLATYRRVDNKVLFGANAVLLEKGRIAVGDEVRLD